MRVDSGLSIAIVASRGAAWFDGTDAVAEELGSRLAEAGHRVSVFCPKWRAEKDGPPCPGVQRVCVPVPRWLGSSMADVLSLVLAGRGFDLVYLFGSRAALLGFWPKVSGSTFWIRLGGAERPGRTRLLSRAGEFFAMRSADAIVTDTEATLHHLRVHHGRLPAAFVIPDGAEVVSHADPDPLTDWELAPGCYYLAVCRPLRENHVLEIIEGFLAAHSAFPLVIVGDVGEDSTYEMQLRSFAGARIRFIGAVSEPGRRTALRYHARAYFHGNTRGPSPSLLAALGCGSPVIAYDTPGTRELTGDLAQYFRTAQDIPRAVVWAEELDGPERRARAAEAQARLRTRFTWERVTDAYRAALTAVPRLR